MLGKLELSCRCNLIPIASGKNNGVCGETRERSSKFSECVEKYAILINSQREENLEQKHSTENTSKVLPAYKRQTCCPWSAVRYWCCTANLPRQSCIAQSLSLSLPTFRPFPPSKKKSIYPAFQPPFLPSCVPSSARRSVSTHLPCRFPVQTMILNHSVSFLLFPRYALPYSSTATLF